MGGSDDSSQDGTLDTKSSSKSSKKSRKDRSKSRDVSREPRKTRKKKTRQRSDKKLNDEPASASAETGTSKKTAGRKKLRQKKEFKDSLLLVAAKNKQMWDNSTSGGNGTAGYAGGRRLNKDVSFSGSTIKKSLDIGPIMDKSHSSQSELDLAMGKMPSPQSRLEQKADESYFNNEAPMEDSMLDTIKSRRSANNGTGGRHLNKDVSFSGSTIKKSLDIGPIMDKSHSSQSELDLAMGKMPKPISSLKGFDSAALNDWKIGDSPPNIRPQGKRDSGSALRPSKYGNITKPGSPKPADATAKATIKFAEGGNARRKPTFQSVDYGSEDDNDAGRLPSRRLPSRRSRSLTNIDVDDDAELRGSQLREASWKPDAIGGVKKRRSIDESDEERKLRSSLTANRPGIQRRNTMGSLGSQRKLELSAEGDTNGDESTPANLRDTMLHSIGSQQKQLRRMKMSVANQIYIPPKSRQSSATQRFTNILKKNMVDLTLWTYQTSFFKVLLFFLGFYFGMVFMWAAVLDGVDSLSGGQCIHEDVGSLSNSERYEYVFELAWATFTTVGYGTIAPLGDQTGCYPVRFTCAFVAFVGVLFASTTAAIMYSKLMRLLAQAHITFSSTLCIQYGKGNEGSTVRFGQLNFRASVAPALLEQFSATDLLADDGEESPSGSEDGFPVIEFRMINDRANFEGSEIWDAQIRGIVQLHKEPASDTNGFDNKYVKEKSTGGESTLDLEKKVYYPILLSPDTHPHFSRIWYARHTLNAESPLLKRDIRDMIVKDGGKWDVDFNHWQEIRDCLNEFISLRITLSGTSAVSASTVYGEHVYEFDDVCVGWRFANMVYETKERAYSSCWRTFGCGRALMEDEKENHDTSDMRTKIDAALLHDIIPQPGGDHEPLNETKK